MDARYSKWRLVKFDRIERDGGSKLFGKRLMAFGYTLLQPLARSLVRYEITANTVSWLSLASGFLAGFFIAFGSFFPAALLSGLSGILDSLDGLVARLSGTASDSGEVLDAGIDRYVEFFFCGGLVFYYRSRPFALALVLLALAGSFMVSYSTAKAEALHVTPPRGNMRRPERALYLALGAAFSAVSIEVIESRMFVAPFAAYPMLASLAIVGFASNYWAVLRLYRIAKTVKRMEPQEKGPDVSCELTSSLEEGYQVKNPSKGSSDQIES